MGYSGASEGVPIKKEENDHIVFVQSSVGDIQENELLLSQSLGQKRCLIARAGCCGMLSLRRRCCYRKEKDLSYLLREAAQKQEDEEEIEAFLAGVRLAIELEDPRWQRVRRDEECPHCSRRLRQPR